MARPEYIENVDTGCWEWARARDKRSGYGWAVRGGKPVRAHRAYYAEYVGPIPNGMYVLHSCDNPPCVNPSHLSVGTQHDNMRQMIDRGRINDRRGEQNPRSKITMADARKIRRLSDAGHSRASLAAMFGINPSSISAVATGRTWRDVDHRDTGPARWINKG